MPLTEHLIRPAMKREIAEIESLGVAAYAQYQNDVPPVVFDAYIDDLLRLAEHWEEAEVLIAECNGRVAGSVLLYADASTEGLGLPKGWAGFRKLAVHPDMRGLGLGRKLVGSCIGRARLLGAPAVGIHTASSMRAARADGLSAQRPIRSERVRHPRCRHCCTRRHGHRLSPGPRRTLSCGHRHHRRLSIGARDAAGALEGAVHGRWEADPCQIAVMFCTAQGHEHKSHTRRQCASRGNWVKTFP